MLHECRSYEALRRINVPTLRELFANDAARFTRFHAVSGSFTFDYAKQRVTEEVMSTLEALVQEAGVAQARADMFAGELINRTEGRAVLHVALRAESTASFVASGRNVMPDVTAVLDRALAFVDAVHRGEHLGASGKPIRHVVNIGIGGSDLGPAMVCEALAGFHVSGITVHHVSNVDPAHLAKVLGNIDPEATVFLVASKTFTTQETMSNAHMARSFCLEALRAKCTLDDAGIIAQHFVAMSTNTKAVTAFGIDEARMFPFWDWVGGRFSLWSSCGLSIAFAVGSRRFRALLEGARIADKHFLTAPFRQNVPMLMAALGVWNHNVLGASTHAVLPYVQRLSRFSAYLQQGEMESNGKRVSRTGEAIPYTTSPVVWGEPGTNGQHAFYQLMHQGTQLIPCDFILTQQLDADVALLDGAANAHAILFANGLAQAEALMNGKTRAEVESELRARGLSEAQVAELAPHKVFPGNIPSSLFVTEALTPQALGELIALYEHKIFVQGILWDVPSFDQWGVELGKELAQTILKDFAADTHSLHDASTSHWIAAFRNS
jgi:glucose-6-phosphate isomerase